MTAKPENTSVSETGEISPKWQDSALPYKQVPKRAHTTSATARKPDGPSDMALPFKQKESPESPSPTIGSVEGGNKLPAHLTPITLDKYATLCAECEFAPNSVNEIHGRYGIRDQQDREQVDHFWRSRMANDPKLSETYRWHYSQYEKWAKSNQNGK